MLLETQKKTNKSFLIHVVYVIKNLFLSNQRKSKNLSGKPAK